MKPGDEAPDFELADENGVVRSLSGMLARGPAVLYFFPVALSRGCSAESCHFRDLGHEFTALGAQRVGISPDPVYRQREFTDAYSFDFPLLADPDGAVARQFGVRRGLKSVPVKRQTFVVSVDQTVIDVIKSEVRMKAHADRALRALRQHVGA